MGRGTQPAAVTLPHGLVTVPVVACSARSGRSVVSALLAAAFAPHATTVILDTVPRSLSPWPSLVTHAGAGLASIVPPYPAQQLYGAASTCNWPARRPWHVMTDVRQWNARPLGTADPQLWHTLARNGGWGAAVVDTDFVVPQDLVTAAWAGQAGLTARWSVAPQSAMVWCVPATGEGVRALMDVTEQAQASGVVWERSVLAVVGAGSGSDPRPVKAALTMLSARVGAIVRVPWDEAVHAHGLHEPGRLHARTWNAGVELAQAVVRLAGASSTPPAALPPQSADGSGSIYVAR